MGSVPSPDEVEPGRVLPPEVLSMLMRSWRNHWAEVERIARDFPEDVKTKTLLRPVDPDEALAETRAQFAVLFHPDAINAFVSYLNAAIYTIDTHLKGGDDGLDDVDPRRELEEGEADDVLTRLEERVHLIDRRLEQLLERGRDGD